MDNSSPNGEPAQRELPSLSATQLFRVGVLLEAGLSLVGLLIGVLALDDLVPFRWSVDPLAAGQGVLATLPLLAYALFALSPAGRRLRPLREIHDTLEKLLGQALPQVRVWQVVLLAAAAGFGEEVLFRGYVEPWIGLSLTPISTMLAGATVFALLHAVTLTYFLFAFAISLYFSWLLRETDNLFVPILVHALYDLVALLILRRTFRESALRRDDEEKDEPPGGPSPDPAEPAAPDDGDSAPTA